mmetsp:Transcript_106922/g.307511  ORF Transcript_106922/g.307511 Transcript_106922/m.307511 type:complete len:369 (+) Transcript_106922:774-1880(+)
MSVQSLATMQRNIVKKDSATVPKDSAPLPSFACSPRVSRKTRAMMYNGRQMTIADQKRVRMPPMVPRIMVTRSTKMSILSRRRILVMRTNLTIRAIDKRPEPSASPADSKVMTTSVHAKATNADSKMRHERPSPHKNWRPLLLIATLANNSKVKKMAKATSIVRHPCQLLLTSVLTPKIMVFNAITEDVNTSPKRPLWDKRRPSLVDGSSAPCALYTSGREASTTCVKNAPFTLEFAFVMSVTPAAPSREGRLIVLELPDRFSDPSGARGKAFRTRVGRWSCPSSSSTCASAYSLRMDIWGSQKSSSWSSLPSVCSGAGAGVLLTRGPLCEDGVCRGASPSALKWLGSATARSVNESWLRGGSSAPPW